MMERGYICRKTIDRMALDKTNKRPLQRKGETGGERILGYIPPQDMIVEKVVLGTLLVDSAGFMDVSQILTPDCFYHLAHQRIYRAIEELGHEQGSEIDMLTVMERLKRKGELTEVGGPSYLSALTVNIGSSAHLQSHALILHELYAKRRLMRLSMEMLEKCNENDSDADDVQSWAENELIQMRGNLGNKWEHNVKDLCGDVYKTIEKACNSDGGITGVPSGFHGIDKITLGWQPTDLIILAARPAMGKTAFALSMAANMAFSLGMPVTFFSLEMSAPQLVMRLVSMLANVEGEKLRTGKLTRAEWLLIDKAMSLFYNNDFFIVDEAGLNLFELRTKARRHVRDKGVRCIMVDYLQLVDAGMRQGNVSREQMVSTVSRGLKQLAKELGVPIIALSQLNRGVENRAGTEGKRPQLADLRESGAIEQDADIVCFLHRPEYYNILEDERGNSTIGVTEFIIAKHRNGATGDVKLKFDREFATFRDYDIEPLPSPMHAPIPAADAFDKLENTEGTKYYSSKLNGMTGPPPF